MPAEVALAAIVLAAGRSRRMGRWKASLPWTGGRTLLEAHVARFAPRCRCGIWCALPAGRRDEVAALDLAAARLLWIEDPDAPPFATLTEGLRAVLREADPGWIAVTPVDAPPASASTLDVLVAAAREAGPIRAIRPSFREAGGPRARGGHPVLLSRPFAEEARGLDPATARLDHLLRALEADRHAFVAVDDPLVVADLDTPEAYQAALDLAIRSSP